MADYQSAIALLYQWGLRDLLIPFALIFTLVFALMQKIKIFKVVGKDEADKKISTVIALGFALAALIPHFTGRGFDVVKFMNEFLPNSFVRLFLVLLFLALIGTVSKVKKPGEHPLIGIIALIAVFTLVIILLQATQQISYPFLHFLNDPNTQAILIVGLVFVLVIWYISKKPTAPGTPVEYFTKFKEQLQKLFGG